MRTTLTRLSQLPGNIMPDSGAETTESLYKFRVPSEYLRLIDPDDPNDPIKKLIVPSVRELAPADGLDPTNELSFTVAPGLQHKFPDTALILSTINCAGYCRYCFRKRLFQPNSVEVPRSFSSAIQYIHKHPEITNVLLSGGDPLSLKTEQLNAQLSTIAEIPHVRIIRIGTKTPAFDPRRILEDALLVKCFERILRLDKQIYLITHFDHPRELTRDAKASIRMLSQVGISCLNQCPLLNGVNSAPGVLNDLFEEVAFIGCPQYYVFHCRPTDGNAAFVLPLLEAFRIFERETRHGSGLSKTARYCIAHPKGKLQVLTEKDNFVLLKFLQACNPELTGTSFWHSANSELNF